MTDLKIKRMFWGSGNFYRYRLQILANLSGKHVGWNGSPPLDSETQYAPPLHNSILEIVLQQSPRESVAPVSLLSVTLICLSREQK